jgi:hypothetical protein
MFPRKTQKKPRTCKRLLGVFQVSEEVSGRSRPLLFAEFLEARIVPERIEHWIEPEQRGSERYTLSQRAEARQSEQFL